MDLQTFTQTLSRGGARGYPLNSQQQQAVDHSIGPLWLLAGPGSGKSEVLVTRTLRLLCVDRVAPASIFLTTFTTKAARNLEDRLASYLGELQKVDSSLATVDLADLRVGTLHSLCNDVLQEVRYPGYQNVRLLNDIEQHLFVYRNTDIVDCQDILFWREFEYAIGQWAASGRYPPNKWQRAKAAVTLLNHIVEDVIDLKAMKAAGNHWQQLAEFYEQYAAELQRQHRSDFAHLQAKFLEFITAPAGRHFLAGDAQKKSPPLTNILVDEYQDTNPIQERIYLALANIAPHNIAVVGDDDQALYRFRGGTVACMVNFDQACNSVFGVAPTKIELDANYRSHKDIVEFFGNYITSFPEMNAPGVRSPGKKGVQAKSAISGNYPAVSWISRKKAGDLPSAVADLIHNHLIGDGIIQDYSQCVLLMRSARDSTRNAGQFITAFNNLGIPVYNPRSKAFLDAPEVGCLLGALIHIIDFNFSYTGMVYPNGHNPPWRESIDNWINELIAIGNDPTLNTTKLRQYIVTSQTELPKLCAAATSSFLNLGLLEILYRIVSCEPFVTWRHDPSQNLRLSKVTRLFESYGSFNLGSLRASNDGTQISESFLHRFYHMFIGYLVETGIDDDEDDDVIVPQGYLPIMTVHQSKGLEFPFVVVGQLGKKKQPGAAQHLENDLQPFRQDLYARPARNAATLSIEDDIRLLFVAYSRAQHGLILAGTPDQIKNHVAAPNRDFTAFRRSIRAI